MQLESLRLKRSESWQDWKGYQGEAIFSGKHGKVQLQVSERLSQRILQQCAEEIAAAAREVAENMSADILEQVPAIGVDEPAS